MSIEWLMSPGTTIPQVFALADAVARARRREAVTNARLTTMAVGAALDKRNARKQAAEHRKFVDED